MGSEMCIRDRSSHVKKLKTEFPNAKPGLGYGLTETNAAGAVTSGYEYIEKPGSTGQPTKPLTEMIICDDNNKKLPNGISGEIYIKTPSNFRCYWNDKNATNEAFYKGWFKTGDIGFLDEDCIEKNLGVFRSRAEDMLNRYHYLNYILLLLIITFRWHTKYIHVRVDYKSHPHIIGFAVLFGVLTTILPLFSTYLIRGMWVVQTVSILLTIKVV